MQRIALAVKGLLVTELNNAIEQKVKLLHYKTKMKPSSMRLTTLKYMYTADVDAAVSGSPAYPRSVRIPTK